MDMDALADMQHWLEEFFGRMLFGVSYAEYFIAGGVMLVSLLLVFLTRPLLRRVLRDRIDQSALPPKVLKSRILKALVPPVRVLPLIIGLYIALHILHLRGKPSLVAGQILASLIVAMVFWAIMRLTVNTEILWSRLGASLERSVRRWLGYTIRVLILIVGGAIILEIWQIPIAPLIGSLGVLGIGVGLAAKDLFTNLISGILIMSEKRFGVGDWIQVEGIVDGTVEEVNFRSTRVRAFDLTPVYVPNSFLANNAMVNYSRMLHRRIDWIIALPFGTSPEKLQQVRAEVESWLINDTRIPKPPQADLFVRIDNFGPSSVNLMVYCFSETTVWAEWLKVKEALALAIIRIVNDTGTGFAFPSQSVFLHQADPLEVATTHFEAHRHNDTAYDTNNVKVNDTKSDTRQEGP